MAGKPCAVLWDLDGTLLDSNKLHWLAWQETAAAEGLALTYEQFMTSFGQRNDTTLRGWFGADMTAAEILRIGEAKEERYRRLMRTRGIELLPGVETWLLRLAAAEWRQAIATMAPRANVAAILEMLGIEGYFTGIITADDVQHGKPNPQVFQVAARELGVPSYRCIVVEDSPAGVEAARRAGMRAVGTGPRFAELKADLTTRWLSELAEDAFDRLLILSTDHLL